MNEAYLLQRLHPRRVVACLRLAHALADADELSIKVFEASRDGALQSLLNLLLDETGRERLERLVQHVVLRVADRELEGVDLHVHVLDLEHRRLILVRRREVNGGLSEC